jgi:hypothetical protein
MDLCNQLGVFVGSRQKEVMNNTKKSDSWNAQESDLQTYTGLRENGMSDGKIVFWTQNPVRTDHVLP